MSRLSTMSPAAIKAVFSPESDSSLIVLLTLYLPDSPGQAILLSDSWKQRLPAFETATEVVYGVISRGLNYIFLPLEITLPSEEDGQPPRSTIILHDVTRNLTPIIRGLTSPPKVKLELVLSSSPDTVEASFSGLYITNFSYNATSVTAELSMIDYDREPFPSGRFTPSLFPGLF
jgi:hypothetical protein